MPVITSSRPASVSEISAEMDRRGHVIEKLEATLRAADAAILSMEKMLDDEPSLDEQIAARKALAEYRDMRA